MHKAKQIANSSKDRSMEPVLIWPAEGSYSLVIIKNEAFQDFCVS